MRKKHKNIARNVYAKKSLGQNFLVDGDYVEKIISALNLKEDEFVLEIGPGRGALTRRLIEKKARVVAIELDRDLISILKDEFGDCGNFSLIEGDALSVDFEQMIEPDKIPFKVVANLPYYISTAILQKLIEQRKIFSELVLMLQSEVVDRIAAPAGNSERGYLSVLAQAYFQIEKLFEVPPTAFRPIPKIWSAVIKLESNKSGLITSGAVDEILFWQIVSVSFAQKRKTIFNNLKSAPFDVIEKISAKKTIEEILATAEIEKNRRAETLTIEDWKKLFIALQ